MTPSKAQLYFEAGTLSARERRKLRRQAREGALIQEPKPKRSDLVLPVAKVPKDGAGLSTGGFWNPIGLRVPTHTATTRDLSGTYPFVADSGIGVRGPILGVDVNADSLFAFSPWEAYLDESDRGTLSTNILVLGAYRAGKSGTVKCLVSRGFAWGYQAVVPSDSKGEWTSLANATEGGVVIKAGRDKVNPLARGYRREGVTDDEDEKMVQQRRITTLVQLLEMVRPGGVLAPAEHAVAVRALNDAIEHTHDRPTLRAVLAQVDRMVEGHVGPTKLLQAAEDVQLLLARYVTGDLSGLFEDESTVEFDQDAPIVVVDTSELFQRSELVAQVAQVCTTSWVQSVISDRSTRRRRFVVREEGWRDMTSLAALRMYQQWLKLSRHYGIANIVILHKMGDLDAVGPEGSQERALAYSVAQEIENKFIFHVNRQEEDNLRHRLNLPSSHIQVARRLRKGEFIAYVGKFAYVVDCFATSTPSEFALFKTDDALMHDRDVRGADPAPPELSIDDLWPAPPVDDPVKSWLAAAPAANGGTQ